MDINKLFIRLTALKHIKIEDGRFMLYNTPLIALFPNAYADLLKALNKAMGEKEAGKQVYSIFIEPGEDMAKIFYDNSPKRAAELILYTANMSGIGGWGVWKEIYSNTEKLEGIYTQKNFAVPHYFVPSQKPVCHISRGLVAGVWRFVTKADVDCIELSCVAQGYPECTFKVGTKENLKEKHADFVEEQLP